jgi:glycosyltransferase involved in cell wall biosynthesis
MRLFYTAGPGNLIRAHQHWEQGQSDPGQMSLTYSSQFADFCKTTDSQALIISSYPSHQIYHSGQFFIEHCPKPFVNARGIFYHLSEMLYGFQIFFKALRFRADVAVIHSGTTHLFMLILFRLTGIHVVPVLHNSLWPKGFKPTRTVPKLILRLNAMLFRRGASAVIGISPECLRQVSEMTGGRRNGLIEMHAQFSADYFAAIVPPPVERQPFKVLFCGRVTRDKGVYDLLLMAQRVEQLRPGLVHWIVCGNGPDLTGLREEHARLGLGEIVNLRGFTPPHELQAILGEIHAVIVPTRGEFTEGMAKSAIEAILAGRPCITSPVVPALEVLRPACMEARTNDVESYVAAIIELAQSPQLYEKLCAACPALSAPFYDPEFGFSAAMRRAVALIRP